ncbi:MAG: hypothetical protein GXP54_00375 [Deltaproteobacteria bacterium]|nr:hypothetical protein [Deltaproteobacteria bacterium]
MRKLRISGYVLTALVSVFLGTGCGGGQDADFSGADAMKDQDVADLPEVSSSNEGVADTVKPGVPCIKVTPSPVDFGGRLIGQPALIDVEIESCGTAPLEVTDIFLQDGTGGTFPSSPDFLIDYAKLPAGVRPTVEKPVIVDADDSVAFTMQCTPDQQNPMDPVTGQVLKDKGTIQINTPDAEVEIETLCFGVLLECPQPIIVV